MNHHVLGLGCHGTEMSFVFLCFNLASALNQASVSLSLLVAKDRPAAKSLVIGRPILLALEDIDGTPSFLEKALRFLEGPGECLFLLMYSNFFFIACLF